MIRRIAFLLAAVLIAAPAQAENQPAVDIETLESTIADQHPAAYYELAGRLFAADRKDEAVFWFYAGQLRYRIHLTCHPDLQPDGDPALFASLSESLGRPLNEYAFGDTAALAATIARVLEWDEATPNGFTSKTECADAVTSQRAGLAEMERYVQDNAETIRRQRSENGLPNR